jgi:hypothetical protein
MKTINGTGGNTNNKANHQLRLEQTTLLNA